MALDSDSDSGSGALLGVIVGALLIGAVALFAFGAFDHMGFDTCEYRDKCTNPKSRTG